MTRKAKMETRKTTPPRIKSKNPRERKQPGKIPSSEAFEMSIEKDILEAINEILEEPEPPYGTGVLEAPPTSRPPPPKRPPKVGTAIQRSDKTNQRKLAMLATPPPPLSACRRRCHAVTPMRTPAKRPRSPSGQEQTPEERTPGKTPPAPPPCPKSWSRWAPHRHRRSWWR
ncbi:WAS/WASL-interacting protein family member 1-like [Polyergus mexicanus]|uniref:WAS/WASL-interacting protein family member 1-like n=1 Tax=Polyergus mexicanus TaxID=615972 RepID=UPI0038B5F9B8